MAEDVRQVYVRELMELMLSHQFASAEKDPASRTFWQTTIHDQADALMTKFAVDKALAESAAATKEDRVRFDKNLENLSKALPGMTKGTLSAITSFSKGDAIGGSAAVMEICASVAPLLAGLSAAGGPPGMVVGAVFAMVGQILSFFAPKAESVTSQFEKILREERAEQVQQTILTVHQNIRKLTTSLKAAADRTTRELDKPLLNILITDDIITMFNPLEGTTVSDFQKVMNWLDEDHNQALDLWPVILSAACQAWADMMVAALNLMSLVHDSRIQGLYDAAAKLPEASRTPVETNLKRLQANVISRLLVLKAVNDIVLEILQGLVPATRDRGTLWTIDSYQGGYLYAGTSFRTRALPYLKGNRQTAMAAVVSRDGLATPRPTYQVFTTQSWFKEGGSWSNWYETWVAAVAPPYGAANWARLTDASGSTAAFDRLSDCWPTASDAGEPGGGVRLDTARGREITRHAVDGAKATPAGYTRTLESDVLAVRTVRHPDSTPGDPDGKDGSLAGITDLIYAKLATKVHAETLGEGDAAQAGYLDLPAEFSAGIAVDSHHLWVFGPTGFACATHASVVRCLRHKLAQPRWMVHHPDTLLYEGNQHPDPRPDPKPLLGVLDLCPCDDGTLVAVVFTRSVVSRSYSGTSSYHYNEFLDLSRTYSAEHRIDVEGGHLDVKWTRLPDVSASRIQKLPVPCWSSFDGLRFMLEQLAQPLASV